MSRTSRNVSRTGPTPFGVMSSVHFRKITTTVSQETNIIRAVRPWEAEFSKPYNRGLLIDCEGGETIIARTDTAAEQEEWTEALMTVTDLLGSNPGEGGGAGGVGYDSDDDDDDGNGGGGMQTTYLAQKDELLSSSEATGPCVVVFQVWRWSRFSRLCCCPCARSLSLVTRPKAVGPCLGGVP